MRKNVTTILLLICLTFAAACGKKAPPVAPETVLPNRPTELSVVRDNTGVTLKFKLPKKNSNGTDFTDFKGIEVYKATLKEGAYNNFCKNCDEDYSLIYSGGAALTGRYVTFRDDAIKKNAHYYYRVKVVSDRGKSDFSAAKVAEKP